MDTDLLWALPGRVASQIVEAPSGCWEWTGRTIKGGYGRPSVNGALVLLHRLMWELVHGPIPGGLQVRHVVCDNPPCCNPAHLALGTNQDNMNDRNRRGRQAKGSAINTAKMTPMKVRNARRLYATGLVTSGVLAQLYDVNSGNMSRILNRKTWRHI